MIFVLVIDDIIFVGCMDVFGLLIFEEDGKLIMEELFFGMLFVMILQGYDFYVDDLVSVKEIKVLVDQMFKEFLFILGLIFLVFIYFL